MKNSNLENLTDLHVNYENDETLGWKDKLKDISFTLILIATAVFFMLFIMGVLISNRSDNEKVVFENREDIQVKTTSYSQIACINICGTYKKNDIKYYIFTTDITGDKKFALSEYEYDKYIGLDNNAVDCTVYNLNCYSDVYSLEVSPRDFIENSNVLKDMLNNIENVSCGNCYKAAGSKSFGVYITHTDGEFFEDFFVSVKKPVNSKNTDISSEFNICRYSFMGETNFLEEEIGYYLEIMENLNIEIVECCRESCPQSYFRLMNNIWL